MTLHGLQVFNQYAYTTVTEILQQQIALFNAATRGAIILRASANQGDFTDAVHYAKLNMVRRRNVYADGALTPINLVQLLDTAVKVAAGTFPVQMDPAWFNWIMRDPAEAGVVIGQQLAPDMLADMLNTAILGFVVSHGNVASITNDVGANNASLAYLTATAGKFGDQAQRIVAWVMHSKPLFDLYAGALANGQGLFTFGNVNVSQDGFGRVFVISDSPALIDTVPAPDEYLTLGLTPGAIVVERNPDFTANIDTRNEFENIRRTYQSEWSYNLGVKGFAWNKTSGGASPSNSALASSANWTRYATSDKDLGGVVLRTT